ncbi:FecR family protein [Massilibacteroides vaginae]|uniref:FecR family protein n=1 Tax=Massilibacteroides vaginae TaxID=1673718 RepID=UPI000A1C8F13|nr:FecR family protein [Massilibacteroides vaginae]
MKNELNIDKEVLFFRYSNNLATSAEREEVEKLISEHPEARDELAAVQQALSLRQKIKEMELYDISAGYGEVKKSIRMKNRKSRYISILTRVAAILTLPLLISTFTLLYFVIGEDSQEELLFAEVTSAPGMVTRFELPDKSKVWLNSNATLRYPIQLNHLKKREVELTGEGFFEVESNKDSPFYVSTASGMRVMAHGTQFNINTESQMVETVLAEGKVSVLYKDHVMKEMLPGEQSLFDSETGIIKIQETNLAEKLAWKDGKIIFRNAPLDEVFDRLSRRYNIEIVLHDEHNQSGNYLSRVTFTDETIQQIFSYLEIAAPIAWKLSSPIQKNDSTLVKQRIDVWLKKK